MPLDPCDPCSCIEGNIPNDVFKSKVLQVLCSGISGTALSSSLSDSGGLQTRVNNNMRSTPDGLYVGPLRIYGWSITNNNATLFRYYKLVDQVASPVVGTTPAKMVIGLPPMDTVVFSSDIGITFTNGFWQWAVDGPQTSSTGNPAANEVIVQLMLRLP